ncbi:phage protein Gp36 family protein [Rhodoferax sp. BLA1]|uniref:phage protein Gp36 family protein n=1 Tax=Rhodoferax sp. BLA1 TaxID=2576062 RepID=UPI0015D3D912|nr:phage protein Gp36 family protein [Rhodoferax sp. BLA1]
MGYATRADLLARTNARRLAQLAVPADVAMVPLEVMRAALDGSATGTLDTATAQAVALALQAVDKALGDADALMQSYGVPATATGTMLTRIACTLAMYYLQGAERLEKDEISAYDGVISLLKQYRRGEIDLTPGVPADPAEPEGDLVSMESAPARYGSSGESYGWSET